MAWEVVIGLETHAQLSTRSKIFSGASTAFGAAPNTQACAVDLALPGVLPVLNRGAVERAIKFGLAIGATVAPRSVFARKNYFYPDLPKGYQISQYEIPVVQGGSLSFVVRPAKGEPHTKTVRLTRAHLEEDAGKSLHEDRSGPHGVAALGGMTGIDLNRAGTPLLEIVSEPDLRSSDEAVAYAKALHALVTWLGICDGNMQEGSFRCDANVSVRPLGQKEYGTRCEIKNLNSFKFLQAAIDYEVRRQIELIEDGGTVVQETRLYDPDRDETRSMRSKEDAMDYRYFPDPDLLPLAITNDWIEAVKPAVGELPWERRQRYRSELLLLDSDVETLLSSKGLGDFFDATLARLRDVPGIPYLTQTADVANAKSVANWIVNNICAFLNEDGLEIELVPVTPTETAFLIGQVLRSQLSAKSAKQLLRNMWEEAREKRRQAQRDGVFPLSGPFGEPLSISLQGRLSVFGKLEALIEARGLKQISDAGAIEKLIDEVLAANAKSVEEFKAGKEKAFNALVGHAMRATKGKANPQQVNEILRRKLAG